MVLVRAFSPGKSRIDEGAKAFQQKTLRAVFSLIFAAMLLRIGSMLNQVVISAHFGAGEAMDAYFVASAFPLLLVQLISSALEAAVIPVYSRLSVETQRDAASRSLSTLINCVAIGALFLMLILIFASQPLAFLSAPGLGPARLRQAVALAPWFYLSIPISLLTNLLTSLLNVEGQFGWAAYAGLLAPLTIALLTIVSAQTWGIFVLCVGSLCGAFLQMLLVCIRARRLRLRYRPVIHLRNTEVRLICRAAWPVLLGALITQGGPLVDQAFASTLSMGSISALNYALKLVSVFIGVIVVSFGRVALPHLSRQAACNDGGYGAFKKTLHLYLWSLGLCALALSSVLGVLGYPLVQMLFQHGAFSSRDVHATMLIFVGFLPGLTPIALNFVLTKAFNALGETRIPMYMAFVSVCANALFDALLAHFWGGLGIALATSIVSLIVCILLLILLHWRIGPFSLWRAPFELRMLAVYIHSYRRKSSSWLKKQKKQIIWSADLRHACIRSGVTGMVLLAGIIVTVRDALAALRISVGALLLISFLRYPFMLLLAWASLDICIGSTIPGFNGNNLDILLVLPLLSLLVFFPWRQSFRQMPGFIWLLLYLFWVLLGIGLSPLTTSAFLTLWLTMLASMGVGVLTLALVSTRARLDRLINVLLIVAVCIALYGYYGFITHQNGELDVVTSLFRISSIFTQATTCAFYFSVLLPLAFYRCICTRGIYRLGSLGITGCLLGALILTFTRSAYVAVLASAVILIPGLPDYRMRRMVASGLVFFGGAIIALAWLIHVPLLGRFFNGDLATLNGRFYLWQALLSNFQITRWLGSGLLSSDQLLVYLHVGAYGQGVIGTAPHSLFLGTLYDHGIIGLLLLCIAFFFLGSSLLRGLWRSSGERRMLYATALACLLAVLFQSLGSRDLWIQAVGAPFWIIIALPFTCYWTGKEKGMSLSPVETTSFLSKSSPIPDFLPLCQVDTYVEGEV